MQTTEISFPAGAVTGDSVVTAVLALPDGRHGVVTAATPFHPLDHTWPDQPGDTGLLGGAAVLDTVTAAAHGGETFVGTDIPVRRGDPEWTWHVLHVVGEPPQRGAAVALRVDTARRTALSAGHTGCHLVAFALNAALAGCWRKDVVTDSLGNPDFDALAMVSSHITEYASTDVYRIGKSLRKKGFTPPQDWSAVAATVNAQLAGWLRTGAQVAVQTDGPLLTDRRRWRCTLPSGTAEVACGGTHLRSLAELATLTVRAEVTETGITVRSLTSTLLEV